MTRTVSRPAVASLASPPVDALADRLARRTLELVDLPSESRLEQAAVDHCAAVLQGGGVPVRDLGDTCVLAGAWERTDRPLVLLAGHLDTVPAQANRPGRIGDGPEGLAVHGCGSTDMKGAVAVMLELLLAGVGSAADEARACDLGVVLFGREELPFRDSALGPMLAAETALHAADLAVVMEPTSGGVQGGCLGNVNATWSFPGVSAHSARPWLGGNAVHRAARGVAALAEVPVVRHVFSGLEYAECVSVTRIAGGTADNVVPDRAAAHVNYRYPPGVAPQDALDRLRGWCAGADPGATLEILGNAPSGPVTLDGPLARALIARTGGEVTPKQAWTPVAELGAVGIPALNFGPGDPALAHTQAERVSVAALVESHETLAALVRDGA